MAAVLLVSDNFLASDYIMTKELPYFLGAYRERGLMIFWMYLEPCDLKRHTETGAKATVENERLEMEADDGSRM